MATDGVKFTEANLVALTKAISIGARRVKYTDKELEYSNTKTSSYQHLAARFAAKEAVLKALGNGWTNRVEWTNIEIWNEKSGKPNVSLSGEAKRVSKRLGVAEIIVSMSHTRTYAVANAILIKK